MNIDDAVSLLDQAEDTLRDVHRQLDRDAIVPDYYPVLRQLVHITTLVQSIIQHRIPVFSEIDPGGYYDHDLTTGHRSPAGDTLRLTDIRLTQADTALTETVIRLGAAWSALGRIGAHVAAGQ